jgi:hypothetical protein
MSCRSAPCVALSLLCAAAATGLAQSPAAFEENARIDRYDPFLAKLVAVAPADVKPGFVYLRYSPQLKRRVWSVAAEGGGFLYAMAPGSVQPARALDLRATPQQMRAELMARAPELAKIMDIRGGVAYVVLTDQGAWQLVRQPTIANVYDLETGRRWEWHGERRVAVVHTGGDDWLQVDGRFVPASYPVMAWSAYPARAGSACCY